MPQAPIFFDITELTNYPVRTGIQRVEREILRRWPGQRQLVPCVYDVEKSSFLALPDAVVDILISDVNSAQEDVRKKLLSHLKGSSALKVSDLLAGLHNAEVFFEPTRADAYRMLCSSRSAAVSWLVYDFLPYLRPQDYGPRTPGSLMHYIRALREISHTAFISEWTRQEYIQRVIRNPATAGPAIPLGGDGIPIAKRSFNQQCRMFTYVGTIEPRKNVATILEAFELLWSRGVDVSLTVIGRIDSRAIREPAILDRLKGHPRFSYLGHAGDEVVQQVLDSTRATLFVSSLEGFGIPPFESLASGIPVIASQNLPSLDLLPAGGRIQIENITPTAIAEAVVTLLDDSTARRLWAEAAALSIPTWDGFVQSLSDWLHSIH